MARARRAWCARILKLRALVDWTRGVCEHTLARAHSLTLGSSSGPSLKAESSSWSCTMAAFSSSICFSAPWVPSQEQDLITTNRKYSKDVRQANTRSVATFKAAKKCFEPPRVDACKKMMCALHDRSNDTVSCTTPRGTSNRHEQSHTHNHTHNTRTHKHTTRTQPQPQTHVLTRKNKTWTPHKKCRCTLKHDADTSRKASNHTVRCVTGTHNMLSFAKTSVPVGPGGRESTHHRTAHIHQNLSTNQHMHTTNN